MRRSSTVAVALAALLITAAFAASAHAAETPEWFECVKQQGGSFQKFCGAEGGKGGYIARPGIGSGSLGANGTKVTLGGPRDEMTCLTTVKGVKQMPNLLTSVTIKMLTCHRVSAKGDHCELQVEKEGPKEGQFESEPMQGELGYISRSPLRVGLKLSPVSGPNGIVFPRLYCIGPAEHFLLRGSFVAEVGNGINAATTKMTLNYVPGPYLGAGGPNVDPPLEGEEAGGFVEEIHTTGESFGMPMPAAVGGTEKVAGPQMVKA